MKQITKKQAREALDSMDDFARMDTGVDAKGPRAVLERYIKERERDRKEKKKALEEDDFWSRIPLR